MWACTWQGSLSEIHEPEGPYGGLFKFIWAKSFHPILAELKSGHFYQKGEPGQTQGRWMLLGLVGNTVFTAGYKAESVVYMEDWREREENLKASDGEPWDGKIF